jgi:hypothetical protein
MTGEEAEISEGIEEEMEPTRRVERASSPTAPAQATGSDRRRDPSVRLDQSHAGKERRALRQSGGNSQRWHEAVERYGQNPALDALQTSGAHDAQDQERPAPAPAPPAAVKLQGHLSHARQGPDSQVRYEDRCWRAQRPDRAVPRNRVERASPGVSQCSPPPCLFDEERNPPASGQCPGSHSRAHPSARQRAARR